jgi:oxygen-independent coproporphyrinogen-3 oxidase
MTYMAAVEQGRLPRGGAEVLSDEQVMMEALYLGLRTAEGIDLELFDRRFGVKFRKVYAELIAAFEAEGLLRRDPQSCALTPRGMLMADGLAAAFIGHEIDIAPAGR